MKKFTLLLDQDDTLCEFTQRILDWWNEDHQTKIKLEDIKQYNIRETLGKSSEYFLRSCMRYPDFFTELEPTPGAIEGVKTLIEQGHQVIIASKVPRQAATAFHGKLAWLRKNMPFFDLNNFVAIQQKEFLQGDWLVDDSPENIEKFLHCGRNVITFDRPWNREVKNSYRVSNWEELITFINNRLN